MKYWLVVIILIFVQTVIGQQLDLNYSKINYGNQVRYLTARSFRITESGTGCLFRQPGQSQCRDSCIQA